jgi:hypothetical protein
MIRRLVRSESGVALVTGIVLMSLMLMVGLSSYAYVGTQQRESGRERARESSFNYAEAALGAQTFVLARRWPDDPDNAFADFCTSSSSSASSCPNASFIAQSYSGIDYDANATWVVNVRDDGGDLPDTTKVEQDSSKFYDPKDDDLVGGAPGRDNVSVADDADDTAVDAQPRWDYNDNGRMWVRAQGTVQGKRRTLIALVDVDEVAESFPFSAITANTLNASGNPHLPRVETTSEAPVMLRDLAGSNYTDAQISPAGAVKELPAGANQTLSDRALDRLRQRAIADGGYYESCPDPLPEGFVFIEASPPGGYCKYQGNTEYNCDPGEKPGVLVIASGGLELKGTTQYCGLVYLANRSDPQRTDAVLDMGGDATIRGTVAVDGPGGANFGTSADVHVQFDPNAVSAGRAYPSGSVVPSTWREIQG